MPYKLPEKFARSTRWAYLNNGIEAGPFSAEEILKLLEERTIGPDTTLILLGNRRTCPVLKVKPFADYVAYLIAQHKWEQTERDFQKTKSQFERGDGLRNTILGGLAIALVVGGLVTLAVMNPFAAKTEKVDTAPPRQAVETGPDVVAPPETKKEEEFRILEADDPIFREDEDKKLVETVKKEQLLAATSENLDTDKVKLVAPKSVIPLEARKHKRKNGNGHKPGGVQAQDEPDPEPAITTMDFGEDDEEEDSGLQSSIELAEKRLGESLRKCSLDAMYKHQDVERWSIMAQAVLEPSGRMKGLKLTITPTKHVGEIKMCTSAEVMRQRVPAYDGPATTVVVNATVTAN